MLFISKDSKQAKVLANIMSNVELKDKVYITSDNLYFFGTNTFKKVKITFEKTLDITNVLRVSNTLFVRALVSELLEKDVEVEIKNNKITFGAYEFAYDTVDTDYIPSFCNDTPHITWTKSQWENLKKDTFITAGNFWKSEKLTNVSVIQIIEGKPYSCAPGSLLYKFGKIDATVDASSLEHEFGHSSFGIAIKNTIIDTFANSDFDTIYLTVMDGGISTLTVNNVVSVEFEYYKASSNLFKNRLGLTTTTFTKKFEFPEEVVKAVTAYNSFVPYRTEDIPASIKQDGSDVVVRIDENVLCKIKGKCSNISTNLSILVWCLNNFNKAEFEIIEINDSRYLMFKNGEEFYIALDYSD